MGTANTIRQAHSDDLLTRLRPLLSVAFDWLTIEPIWRGYKRFGDRGAVVVGIGLYISWITLSAIPALIISALLTILGFAAEGEVVDIIGVPVALAAFVLTVYGGYRAKSLLDDRETMLEYAQSPNPERVADAFGYLHRDDGFTRVLAAKATAMGMETAPGRVVKKSEMTPEEVVFEVTDLLHDDAVEVRRSGSEALSYLSEEYPEEVAKYRDDVYSGISYPDSVVQSNCALIAGELAFYEPALADEAAQYVGAAVDDRDPEVRARVAIALGLIHNEKSKEFLQVLQDDSNNEVRQQASEALKNHEQRRRTDADAHSDHSTV